MAFKIHYDRAEIPKGKRRKDYNYIERRAEILKLISEAGHPKSISQSKLAAEYGVSQVQISHDMKAIAEQISRTMGSKADLLFFTVFDTAMRKQMESGHHDKAVQTAEKFSNFLFRRGSMEEKAKKIEVDSNVITHEDAKRIFEEAEREREGKTTKDNNVKKRR